MKLGLVVGVVLTLVACGTSHPSSSPAGAGAPRTAPTPQPTLAAAIGHAVHIGPAKDTTTVSLSFALKVRDPSRLAALIASGRTVTPEAYTAEFGPDPAAVQAAVA